MNKHHNIKLWEKLIACGLMSHHSLVIHAKQIDQENEDLKKQVEMNQANFLHIKESLERILKIKSLWGPPTNEQYEAMDELYQVEHEDEFVALRGMVDRLQECVGLCAEEWGR